MCRRKFYFEQQRIEFISCEGSFIEGKRLNFYCLSQRYYQSSSFKKFEKEEEKE
jgi:hypothetical protein